MFTKEDFDNVRTEILDCVHLKACRRLQKIARNYYKQEIGRKCDEKCTAYQTLSNLIEKNATYTKIIQQAPVMHDLLCEVEDTISDALPLISDKLAMNELLAAFDLIHETLQEIHGDNEA